MDKENAKNILAKELAKYRSYSYSSLVEKIGTVDTFEVGDSYQLEIEFRWDDRPDGDIRVVAGIDDGGWRAFLPITESFIMNHKGSFVDEAAT